MNSPSRRLDPDRAPALGSEADGGDGRKVGEDVDVGNGHASDELLMARIREGCRTSFQLLLERYWPHLMAFSTEVVGRRDEAKDIVQEAFIRVWINRGDWTPIGTVRAYLYRIARNLSLNAVRDRRTRERHTQRDGIQLFGVHQPSTPEEQFWNRRVGETVEHAVNGLPERRREVFILSRYHGLSHREIAEALDISPQTVANQMSAALSFLRSELAELVESD